MSRERKARKNTSPPPSWMLSPVNSARSLSLVGVSVSWAGNRSGWEREDEKKEVEELEEEEEKEEGRDNDGEIQGAFVEYRNFFSLGTLNFVR